MKYFADIINHQCLSLLGFLCLLAIARRPVELLFAKTTQSEEEFRWWNNVERRRNSAALFEVAHPQLRPRKFPFLVCAFLLTIEFYNLDR